MSVKIGGKSFETLDDKIYVGGHKVTKIYAGRKLVYPVREEEPSPYRFAQIFYLKEPVRSAYSPDLVNEYGAYISYEPEDAEMYRAAFNLIPSTSIANGWARRAYISTKNFDLIEKATYIPYVARDGRIIASGLDIASIKTFRLVPYMRNGKYYYSYPSYITANLEDYKGDILTNYTIRTGGENTRVCFGNEELCVQYVLGEID